MARQNRAEVFDPNVVSVQHCVSRVVRRAMLCGVDRYSGKSFEHRRSWVRDRLEFLAGQYAIDVLGFAVMGNHLHVILRNRPDVVATWSDEEVARRIWNLFPKRKNADGSPAEPRPNELRLLQASSRRLEAYRTRLSDISWLMRQVAEQVARRANAEDQCTGRFWEGRFKSQPLLDEAAVLACAAYVDLNPVRAGIAPTPEASEFTSVHERIASEKSEAAASATAIGSGRRRVAAQRPDRWLAPMRLSERAAPGPMPSRSGVRASDKGFLPIGVREYLTLLDWTGRQLVHGKRGRIPARCKPILKRLGLERDVWCTLVKDFGRLFKRVAGTSASLAARAQSTGRPHHRSGGGPALLSH